VDWQSEVSGFCRCPGEAMHTSRTGRKDCRVSVDGAPTIFCFHASCIGAVAEAIAKGLPKTKVTGVPFRMEMSGFCRLEGSLPIVGDIGSVWPVLAWEVSQALGIELGFISCRQDLPEGRDFTSVLNPNSLVVVNGANPIGPAERPRSDIEAWDVGLITAYRPELPLAGNQARNRALLADLYCFGRYHVRGRYVENYRSPDARAVDVQAYLVIGNSDDSGNLKGLLRKCGRKYEQDAAPVAHGQNTVSDCADPLSTLTPNFKLSRSSLRAIHSASIEAAGSSLNRRICKGVSSSATRSPLVGSTSTKYMSDKSPLYSLYPSMPS